MSYCADGTQCSTITDNGGQGNYKFWTKKIVTEYISSVSGYYVSISVFLVCFNLAYTVRLRVILSMVIHTYIHLFISIDITYIKHSIHIYWSKPLCTCLAALVGAVVSLWWMIFWHLTFGLCTHYSRMVNLRSQMPMSIIRLRKPDVIIWLSLSATVQNDVEWPTINSPRCMYVCIHFICI